MLITVFDSEANGFLDQATVCWCIATYSSDDLTLFEPNDVKSGLDYLHTADVLVGHNILEYDLKLFYKLYGWEPLPNQLVVDTLVISRTLNPKRPLPQGMKKLAPHSIEAWGRRLGRYKPEHEDWSKYTPEMGTRCQEDTVINWMTLKELEKEMGHTPYWRV